MNDSDDEPNGRHDRDPPVHTDGHAFDFGDAFSEDGDDHELEFTSAAVREERARNFTTAAWSENREHESPEVRSSSSLDNADVSTIDIDASVDHDYTASSPPQSPASQPTELSVSDLNAQLQDVSLSSEVVEASQHPYPSIVIDVSKSPSSQIIVNPDVERSIPTQDGSYDGDTSFSHSSSLSRENITPVLTSASLPTPPKGLPPPHHRPTRSVGPSALQKVLSKTRPPHLPPKPKVEDLKHQADWENMMKQSRVTEEKRRKALQERRIARERAVEMNMEVWVKEVLPDWKTAVRHPRLRRLWWEGIPPMLRAVVWEKAIGNALALSKDTYRTCLARAKRSLAAGSFPTTTLQLIEADIMNTLPALHIFHPNGGPLYDDLRDLLCAWIVSRSDEGLGYVTGAGKIAAMFLLNMNPTSAFVSMRNLLERHCMRSFYGGVAAKEDLEAYYRIFDTLLADGMPKIYFNFKQHQISPVAYLPDWILPLFLEHLPLEACARIWDVLILEGDSFLFRAALAILAVLEARLYFPDREELLEVLRGENKAALEVVKRERRVLVGVKYEIYGVDEETLWERIDAMEEWWKETTWARLIQRELPDI